MPLSSTGRWQLRDSEGVIHLESEEEDPAEDPEDVMSISSADSNATLSYMPAPSTSSEHPPGACSQEGLDRFIQENTKLRQQREQEMEEEAAPTHPKQKMQAMEMRLDEAALGVGRGRLLDSLASLLDAHAPIKDSRLQNGDFLFLQLSPVQACRTSAAFATILGDGSVLTWGDEASGGDSRAVQEKLKNVQQIQASYNLVTMLLLPFLAMDPSGAFAAILGDGSVVTWGGAGFCSDSSHVQLTNVQQIQASYCAFAAVLADGSVVTWGPASYGGDSSAVQGQLRNVRQIQASRHSSAAILGDGSVVTWGQAESGGDSTAVQDQLKNVQKIQASGSAFAAILGDGSVVTWGSARYGGDSSVVQGQLKNVQQIQACLDAFAAILGDGSVVTWGDARHGGDSTAVHDQLNNVQQIQATYCSFAAILGDGSVVTWGAAGCGGDSTAVQDQLKNVQHVQATESAFAAILGDGSVVKWGDDLSGGDCSAVQDKLKNVQQIQATRAAFSAILGDGPVVTWPSTEFGDERRFVRNVQQIQASSGACPDFGDDGCILIKSRDRELKEKTEIISKLQERVLQQSKDNIALDRKWDERVQQKEEGYGILVAQLKHAEGQILEEREKTLAAKKEIQRRDARIVELKQEHAEELRQRLKDRTMLFNRLRELEGELVTNANREDAIRKEWEATYDDLRIRSDLREADLEIEIVRRDKAKAATEKELLTVRAQFDKARVTWESKERELEVLVRTRDRLVTSLKNEIELVAESWEVKYDKLLSLFDKLQKKYDELLGPGGLAEALRRARDLKEENVELTKLTHELKEMIKKQKRQIRDLQLDIDMHMKETADLILQKEQGIAEMVGDYAKLQASFRKEVEQKERITIELTEEKRAIVASFSARIEQLEQLVEAMRFTDREELVNTIDVWKRAYERICIARDEMEEDFESQLVMKDKQLRKMALDSAEDREAVKKEIESWKEKVLQVEEEWKLKMVPLHVQKDEAGRAGVYLEDHGT
eukprot:s1837_g5.t1